LYILSSYFQHSCRRQHYTAVLSTPYHCVIHTNIKPISQGLLSPCPSCALPSTLWRLLPVLSKQYCCIQCAVFFRITWILLIKHIIDVFSIVSTTVQSLEGCYVSYNRDTVDPVWYSTSFIILHRWFQPSLDSIQFNSIERDFICCRHGLICTVLHCQLWSEKSGLGCSFAFIAAVQYSTVQYSTVQYSTVQCSTAQYRRMRELFL
jgi:hypothetical protein